MSKMTKKYIVETISVFRMRYVVEDECADFANDTVTMNDGNLKEFSQKHLDEIITSTREISDEEYLKLFNEDNDYLSSWTDEQKFQMVNRRDTTSETK